MIETFNISNLDIDYILSLPEVINAKHRIDSQTEGSIYFNIDLDNLLSETLQERFGLDISKITSIPMRWIKGDTKPHIDKSSHSFDKTYLAYLTDSPGELIIDDESYPITKGNAYIFSQGLSHQTIGTCFEPRLLLGPMNEQAISVGAATIILADGQNEIIYIKYDTGSGTTYKINNGPYDSISLPLTIVNTNTSFTLQVFFETDMVLFTDIWYIICGSDNIQFGSSSLNTDGTIPVITIDGVSNYPGLIQNGTNSTPGYNNIYVFNLEVRAINGSSQPNDGGWIGQAYFGKDATNNYIVNSSSEGPIIDGGGGIIGGYSGSGSGASLYIIGCSSDGSTGVYSGGIIGFYAGYNGGQVICENCWSTGAVGQYAGGIFGFYAGNATGLAQAIKCYSTGAIGDEAGGIFGRDAGYDNGNAEARECYSQGVIGTDAGGIFGSYAGSTGGTTSATNCYSSGTITTSGNGIYGSNVVDDNPIRCYVANGSWDDTTANNFLINGLPNPIVGTIWVKIISGQPYELNNMGYTPYTITNINTTPSPELAQTYNVSLIHGNSSSSAIVSGLQYSILQITGGDSSSYGNISINNSTGVISTTSSTIPGTYILYIRNTGSYNNTTLSLSISETPSPPVPDVPICFPAGTPVLTDQGEVPIEKIDKNKHTIRGQQIVDIIKSIPTNSYLVCIEKSSL